MRTLQRQAGRLGTALGPETALWVVVPLMIRRSAAGSPWLVAVLASVAGLVVSATLRFLSNRWWFAGTRSSSELWTAAVVIAALGSALISGGAVFARYRGGAGVDLPMVTATWFLVSTLLLVPFRGRLEFRAWILFHDSVRERTRPYATALLGPDRAVVHDFAEDLVQRAVIRGGLDAADVSRAALWLRIASDDRYRRAVPWSTGRPLLRILVDHLDGAGEVAFSHHLEPGPDDVPVLLQPLCDLLVALSRDGAVEQVRVESAAEEGIRLLVTCLLDSDRTSDPRVDPGTARALQSVDGAVTRPFPDALVCAVQFAPQAGDQTAGVVESVLGAPVELIAESPYSDGARSVYRRGGEVLKVQRHGWIDPKTTLLVDEFHLLRRLRGRSTRFARAIGYGIEETFSWIAYDYVEGEPLDLWLRRYSDEASRRLLSFAVDLQEMLDELAACRVAHRDLNPGNVIVQRSGGLVLIDFDQGASGERFAGADLWGVDQGLAKNDLVEFLDAAGLTRPANELVAALQDAWPRAGVPFSLGVLGHRFGSGWHLDPVLEAVRARMGPLDQMHVLDLCSTAPVAGLVLASAGASVTAVVDDPRRWGRLAHLVGTRFEMVGHVSEASGPFDLTWALGAKDPLPSTWPGAVLVEGTGLAGEMPIAESWVITTALTHLGLVATQTR